MTFQEACEFVAECLRRDLAATGARLHLQVRGSGAGEYEVITPASITLKHFRWEVGQEQLLLSDVAEDVQQDVHDQFIDTAWPRCPAHNHHPLWPDIRGDRAAWICVETNQTVANIGSLATTRT